MNQPPTASSSPFHQGEQILQRRAGKREAMEQFGRKVIRPYLPEQHRAFYAQLPFLVAGCVDEDGWPWASIIAGQAGFVASPSATELSIAQPAIKALTQKHDPLARALTTVGSPIGLLGIELPTRRRNRVNAKVTNVEGDTVLQVDQAFGNCPQYIQTRVFDAARAPYARGKSGNTPPSAFTQLDAAAQKTIQQADTFFVASYIPPSHKKSNKQSTQQNATEGVDVSHRGGLPGFMHLKGNTLTIPDYSGNFHFNTLGNFLLNPKAGLVFPDFTTGNLLLLTGTVILLDETHPQVLAFKAAERAWRFTVKQGLWLKDALPFRANLQEYAPTTTITGTWQHAHSVMQAQQRYQQDTLQNTHSWQPLKVVKIVDESSTIKSFYFEHAHAKALLPFKAGQHLPLSIQLPLNGQRVTRNYTLSAGPQHDYYRLSIKRESHPVKGQAISDPAPLSVSQFMHDTVRVGDIIKAKAPQGHFTIDAALKRPAVLIAAGVGITPIMAMAQHIAHEGLRTRNTRPLTIIHAARNTAQRAFASAFTQLQTHSGGAIRYYSFISQPTPNDTQANTLHGTGRLNANVFKRLLALDDYDFYVCGPSGFIQSTYDALRSLGVNDSHIHAETFGPAAIKRTQPLKAHPASTTPPVQPEAEAAVVTFSQSAVEQRWNKGDKTLLELAEDHGLQPPFSCRSGNCGACAIPVEAGHVSYRQTPSAPIPPGQALLCCAVPAKGTSALRLTL